MINTTHRIIDANINRASEALRILEEWCRFGCNNSQFTEELKSIRHLINTSFSNQSIILSRDSINDLGKGLENPSPKKTMRDIIRSNCKRLEESLRVLSEYGQLAGTNNNLFEEARFKTYSLEKELIKNERVLRLNNSSLYLVTTRKDSNGALYSDNEFLKIIEHSIEGGVDIIQLREKDEDEKKTLTLAKEIKRLIVGTEILFIMNDRVDLALASEADGVHIGQDDMSVSTAREITPEGFIVGLSTHSPKQGLKSKEQSPDYIGVGPVYETPTKPDYTPAGLSYVKWVSENLKDIPWFAIGGINKGNIKNVLSAGAKRVAVVREIINDTNPKLKAERLKKSLEMESPLNV